MQCKRFLNNSKIKWRIFYKKTIICNKRLCRGWITPLSLREISDLQNQSQLTLKTLARTCWFCKIKLIRRPSLWDLKTQQLVKASRSLKRIWGNTPKSSFKLKDSSQPFSTNLPLTPQLYRRFGWTVTKRSFSGWRLTIILTLSSCFPCCTNFKPSSWLLNWQITSGGAAAPQ